MLCNIFQFAPYLYVERLWDEETGKSTAKDVYYIPLKWKKIHRKDDEESKEVDVSDKSIDDIIEIEDVDWYEDYFCLSNKFYDTDKLLGWWHWLKVYVKTATTPATMKALEIENMTRFVQTKLQLLQAKALAMQSGSEPKEFEAIDNKLNELFDIDPDHIMLKSTADKFKEKMAEIGNTIMQVWQNNLSENLNNETSNQQGIWGLAQMQGGDGENIPLPTNGIQDQWGQTGINQNFMSWLS